MDKRPGDIASSLLSFTRSLYRAMRSASPGCSFLEMKALSIAYEDKDPSMKSMAEALGISSPALTAVIDRLVEDGLLSRAEDREDRRVIRVSLTAKGKRDFDKKQSVLSAAINERVSVLSDADQKELARILGILNEKTI